MVSVSTHEWNEPVGAGARYVLTRDLDVASFEPNDGYWHVHERLRREGRLDHTANKCPDYVAPKRVCVWRPDRGWTDAYARSGTAPIPGVLNAGTR